jgi:hypothetical protein
VSGELAQYNPSQFNLLVPTQTVQQLGPWHKLSVSVVKVNPDPMGGEVFKVGSRKNNGKDEDLFMPTKPAVMALANAAGIVWNWRDSLPLSNTPNGVVYRAVGAIRLPDGSWQSIMSTKEIDLTVIADELRQQFKAKANSPYGAGYEASKSFKGTWRKVKVDNEDKNCFFLDEEEKPKFIEASVQANLIQWRKNKMARAETGAMLRVIRTALSMKTAYTKDELDKPFAVPRIDFSPDFNDAQVRQALIENGVQGMAALYGTSRPTTGGAFASSHPALVAGPETDDEPFVGGAEPAGKDAPVTLIDGGGQSGTPSPVAPAAKPAASGEGDDVAAALAGASSAQGHQEAAGECEECHVEINEAVFQYSTRNFGRPLCYAHQPRRQKAGEQAS